MESGTTVCDVRGTFRGKEPHVQWSEFTAVFLQQIRLAAQLTVLTTQPGERLYRKNNAKTKTRRNRSQTLKMPRPLKKKKIGAKERNSPVCLLLFLPPK